MVSPGTTSVSVPLPVVASTQLMWVPLQAPLLMFTTASNPPLPVTMMVCVVAVAVNRYHTSLAVGLVKPLHVSAGMLCVAPTLDCASGEHGAPGAPGVRSVADAHVLLTSGGVE